MFFSQDKFCATCGSVGSARRATRGSIFIELLLWCFFLVPGLIYSIWRATTRYDVCRICGAAPLVPLSSPVAQRALASTVENEQSTGIQGLALTAVPPPTGPGDRLAELYAEDPVIFVVCVVAAIASFLMLVAIVRGL